MQVVKLVACTLRQSKLCLAAQHPHPSLDQFVTQLASHGFSACLFLMLPKC